MPKPRTIHVCQACGYQTPKWLGQCPDCRAWGSLVEESQAGGPAPRGLGGVAGAKPIPITEVSIETQLRARTGIGELDRVLGGGLVPGSLVLLGGDPGIGKSTLLLAALEGLAAAGPVLYVSGEESARQTKLRAERMGVGSKNLNLMCETNAEHILAAAMELQPRALAVDSIQTLHLPDVPSVPGSVTQVREVTGRLLHYAKT
jgi:DNA repair protein RadA/Sms